MRVLRDYQQQAIDNLRMSMKAGNKRVMLSAPVGSGKTAIAGTIVKSSVDKGKRVVFTVPYLSLINQTIYSFDYDGVDDIGVIQADNYLTDSSKMVQIASVSTLERREYPETDLVIVDEAHIHRKAIMRWMMKCPQLPFIGLSATPYTKGLGKYYDDLIVVSTTSELIEKGYLSKFKVFGSPEKADLSKVKITAGDYNEEELDQIMRQPVLVNDVVETWLKIGESRPTIVFAVTRAHADNIHRRFNSAGIMSAYVDAFTKPEDRQRIFDQFRQGFIQIIVNVGVLTTGFDNDVRCIVLARPTKSESLFVQMMGRGLRIAEGKEDCLIIDHTDTTINLGFVDTIHHDKLDMGKVKEASKQNKKEEVKEAKAIECKAWNNGKYCGYINPPKTPKCLSCGHDLWVKKAKVNIVEGDIVQLNGNKKDITREDFQSFYSSMLSIADEKGYKQSWAGFKFQEKFGFWPKDLTEERQKPTIEARNWMKYSYLKWKKGKGKWKKQVK